MKLLHLFSILFLLLNCQQAELIPNAPEAVFSPSTTEQLTVEVQQVPKDFSSKVYLDLLTATSLEPHLDIQAIAKSLYQQKGKWYCTMSTRDFQVFQKHAKGPLIATISKGLPVVVWEVPTHI